MGVGISTVTFILPLCGPALVCLLGMLHRLIITDFGNACHQCHLWVSLLADYGLYNTRLVRLTERLQIILQSVRVQAPRDSHFLMLYCSRPMLQTSSFAPHTNNKTIIKYITNISNTSGAPQGNVLQNIYSTDRQAANICRTDHQLIWIVLFCKC